MRVVFVFIALVCISTQLMTSFVKVNQYVGSPGSASAAHDPPPEKDEETVKGSVPVQRRETNPEPSSQEPTHVFSTNNMQVHKNNKNDNDFMGDELAIRRWGCNVNDAPFIFVHIGKAGGGGVRSRMAAAALEYNRSGWHRTHEDATYYYPMMMDADTGFAATASTTSSQRMMHKGKFVSSLINNFLPESAPHLHTDFTYEGPLPCGATTPLGQAIACPGPRYDYCQDHDQDNASVDRCDLVYMGHNLLGSEFHWLPEEYLIKWWKASPWGRDYVSEKDDFISHAIGTRNAPIGKGEEWIVHDKIRAITRQKGNKMPHIICPGTFQFRPYRRSYTKCAQPKEAIMDQMAHHVVTEYNNNLNNKNMDPVIQYAQMIASLPVTRVTVLREIWSWLSSKFFWHEHFYSRNTTHFVGPWVGEKKAKHRKERDEKKGKTMPPLIKCDDLDEAAYGWAHNRALIYMFYLCGEHCMSAWAAKQISLEDLERQAAFNLRHSFAVVGLLHKTNDFYDMVTQRVAYMNTSMNPEVEGKKHSTPNDPEAMRCKQLYQDPDFQAKLLAKCPPLAALTRLYNLAVEVNAFQAKELAECSAASTT